MIKCNTCENMKKNGNKYTCEKCATRTMYGAIVQQFKEYCSDYKEKGGKNGKHKV